MAWNPNPKETRQTEYRTWQVVLGGYGDQATNDRLLEMTTESREIYSIELLEIRYKLTPGEGANDNRVVRLMWKDSSKANSNGKHYIDLAPQPLSDGSLAGEYNIPRNIYLFDGVNHRPYSQVFNMQLLSSLRSLPVATEYILCTLRVTSKHLSVPEYQLRFEPTILNDRT